MKQQRLHLVLFQQLKLCKLASRVTSSQLAAQSGSLNPSGPAYCNVLQNCLVRSGTEEGCCQTVLKWDLPLVALSSFVLGALHAQFKLGYRELCTQINRLWGWGQKEHLRGVVMNDLGICWAGEVFCWKDARRATWWTSCISSFVPVLGQPWAIIRVAWE